MDAATKRRLEAAGWRVGSFQEFLGLSDADAAHIDLQVMLADGVKARREEAGLTQAQLAKRIGSSQSRVAKMEAGDPEVSLDLLLRAHLALSAKPAKVANGVLRAVAGAKVIAMEARPTRVRQSRTSKTRPAA